MKRCPFCDSTNMTFISLDEHVLRLYCHKCATDIVKKLANKKSSDGNKAGFMKFKHLKTGNIYTVLSLVINATNENDGQEMILYANSNNKLFVRERREFMSRFEPINTGIDSDINKLVNDNFWDLA